MGTRFLIKQKSASNRIANYFLKFRRNQQEKKKKKKPDKQDGGLLFKIHETYHGNGGTI